MTTDSQKCPVCERKLPKRRKRGRPTGFSAPLAADIVAHIVAGRSPRQAFTLLKVSSSTFYRWSAAAKSGEEPYASLWAAIEAAEADFIGVVEDEVRKGVNIKGLPDPHARIAWLSAKDPATWGKRVRIERHAELWSEQMVEAMRRRLSKEAFREFIEALAAEAGIAREGAGEDEPSRPIH